MASPWYNPNYHGKDVSRERLKKRPSLRDKYSKIRPDTKKNTSRPDTVVGSGDRFMGKSTREPNRPKRPRFNHVAAISETPSSQAIINNVPSSEQAGGKNDGPQTPYVNQLLTDLGQKLGQDYQRSRQEVEQTLGRVAAPFPGTGSQNQSTTQQSATNQDTLGQGTRNANAATPPNADSRAANQDNKNVASSSLDNQGVPARGQGSGQITPPFGVGPQRQRSVMAIDPNTGQMQQVGPEDAQNQVRLIQEPGKVPLITNKPFEGELANRGAAQGRGQGGPGRGQGGALQGDGYYVNGQFSSPEDIDRRARAQIAQDQALTPEDRRQNDINQLQADLAYMRSQRRMNPEMSPPGLEKDIEATQKRLKNLTTAGQEQDLQELANKGAIKQQRLQSQSQEKVAEMGASADVGAQALKNQRKETESQREMRGSAMDYVNEAWDTLPFQEKEKLQKDPAAYQRWRSKVYWEYYDNVNNFQHLPNPDEY